ncbi:MAG: hypothetical protein V7L25_26485 [Nostoc sp.]
MANQLGIIVNIAIIVWMQHMVVAQHCCALMSGLYFMQLRTAMESTEPKGLMLQILIVEDHPMM